jgi:hypothetical protein
MKKELQEVYDETVRHLMTQGGPSLGKTRLGDLSCRYRGDEGRRCSVGYWIADKDYGLILEGSTARTPLVQEALSPEVRGPIYEALLCSLQKAHDLSPWTEIDKSWKRGPTDFGIIISLRGVAKTHDLNPAILKEYIQK